MCIRSVLSSKNLLCAHIFNDYECFMDLKGSLLSLIHEQVSEKKKRSSFQLNNIQHWKKDAKNCCSSSTIEVTLNEIKSEYLLSHSLTHSRHSFARALCENIKLWKSGLLNADQSSIYYHYVLLMYTCMCITQILKNNSIKFIALSERGKKNT